MSYASIDPVLDRWVRARGLVLNTATGSREARYWFFSIGRECFQISIEPPTAAGVTVAAYSIETDDDAEREQKWTVAPEELQEALATATETIEGWSRRPRTSA